jgi:hypothetical protein
VTLTDEWSRVDIPTGCFDKHGTLIFLGDIVCHPGGLFGQVVFINGAYRIDIPGYRSSFLQRNSSLLFSEKIKPWQFEVVE